MVLLGLGAVICVGLIASCRGIVRAVGLGWFAVRAIAVSCWLSGGLVVSWFECGTS